MKKLYFNSNLKHLKKIYDDSNSELAAYLNYSGDSGITNLYNRNKGYPPELIDKICARYKITRDMLLYEDLTSIKISNLSDIEHSKLLEFHFKLFPIITPKNCDSKYFIDGYKKHINLLHTEKSGAETYQEFIDYLDLYEQAWNKDNSLPALANTLSSLVSYRSNLQNKTKILGVLKYKDKKISKKILNRDYFLDNNQNDLDLDEIRGLDNLIIDCISVLKKHNDYQPFADYYLAIRYVFNIAHEDLDEATSANISGYLLSDLVYLNNKYAIDYFIFKNSFEKL